VWTLESPVATTTAGLFLVWQQICDSDTMYAKRTSGNSMEEKENPESTQPETQSNEEIKN